MKKQILLFLCFISIISILAQKNLKIFKSDATTVDVVISTIDSANFSQDGSKLNIYKTNKTSTVLDVSTIDSITFNSLPIVRTVSTITFSYKSARAGVVVVSSADLAISEKGVCYSTYENPTIDSSKVSSTSIADSISFFINGLTINTTYFVRGYVKTDAGVFYGKQESFKTLDYALPTVETTSVTNSSGQKATCAGRVISDGGYGVLKARGFCWSKSHNPTIDDFTSVNGIFNGTYTGSMINLEDKAIYYVRAYATNPLGTSYGAELKVTAITISGNVTYNLAKATNPTATELEAYRLIKIAMDSACYYYNRYTTFSKNIYVYYDEGIPTAQASYNGAIGFGKSTTYMHVCTAMHEMAHYMGSGTTSKWQSLTVNGIYVGTAATAKLKSLTGEVLKGDDMHFWPYGLNYLSEVKSANDYIYHAKIVEAMRTDCGW